MLNQTDENGNKVGADDYVKYAGYLVVAAIVALAGIRLLMEKK